MSGFHRVTGLVLCFGTLLLAWWLIATAAGAGSFAVASGFLSSYIGLLVLAGFSWGLIHHLLGGIRHLLWDAGLCFDEPQRGLVTRGTLVASIVLTLLVWIIAFIVR